MIGNLYASLLDRYGMSRRIVEALNNTYHESSLVLIERDARVSVGYPETSDKDFKSGTLFILDEVSAQNEDIPRHDTSVTFLAFTETLSHGLLIQDAIRRETRDTVKGCPIAAGSPTVLLKRMYMTSTGPSVRLNSGERLWQTQSSVQLIFFA